MAGVSCCIAAYLTSTFCAPNPVILIYTVFKCIVSFVDSIGVKIYECALHGCLVLNVCNVITDTSLISHRLTSSLPLPGAIFLLGVGQKEKHCCYNIC